MNPVTPNMPERPTLRGGIGPLALLGFSSRDARASWWRIQIFSPIILLLAVSSIGGIDGNAYDGPASAQRAIGGGMNPLSTLLLATAYLVTFWILLAANVRCAHDRGMSGAILLIGFIPILGSLWLLIELGFLRGMATSNRYGYPP